MVEYNQHSGEIKLDFCYFGPPRAGKGANLRRLHERLPQASRSRLKALDVHGDRILSFDFRFSLPGEPPTTICVSLSALTGEVVSTQGMRRILESADGVVFVGYASEKEHELSMESFREGLEVMEGVFGKGKSPPGVIQISHTDSPSAMDETWIRQQWRGSGWPVFTGCAKVGDGAIETLMCLLRLVYENSLRSNPLVGSRAIVFGELSTGLLSLVRGTDNNESRTTQTKGSSL